MCMRRIMCQNTIWERRNKLIQCWYKQRTRTDDICNDKYESTASLCEKNAGGASSGLRRVVGGDCPCYSSDHTVSWNNQHNKVSFIFFLAYQVSFLLTKLIFCPFGELNQIMMWPDKCHRESKVRWTGMRKGNRSLIFKQSRAVSLAQVILWKYTLRDLLAKPLHRRDSLLLTCQNQGRVGFAQTFVFLNF